MSIKISPSWFLLVYVFLLLIPSLILYYHSDEFSESQESEQSCQKSEIIEQETIEEKDPICSVPVKSAFLTSSQEILFQSLQNELSEKDCRLMGSFTFYLKESGLSLNSYFNRPRINFVKRNKNLIAYVALLALQDYEEMSDIFLALTGEECETDQSTCLSRWLVHYEDEKVSLQEMRNFITSKVENLPEPQKIQYHFYSKGTELIGVPPFLDYYFEDYLKGLTFDNDDDLEGFLIYIAKEALSNKDWKMETFAHFTKKDCNLTKNDCIFEWIAEKQNQEKNSLLIQGEPKTVSI